MARQFNMLTAELEADVHLMTVAPHVIPVDEAASGAVAEATRLCDKCHTP